MPGDESDPGAGRSKGDAPWGRIVRKFLVERMVRFIDHDGIDASSPMERRLSGRADLRGTGAAEAEGGTADERSRASQPAVCDLNRVARMAREIGRLPRWDGGGLERPSFDGATVIAGAWEGRYTGEIESVRERGGTTPWR